MKKLTYILIAILAAICLWCIANKGENPTIEYIVDQGDTIWSIADSHCDMGGDIREVVYFIYEINGINQNENIYPGQAISIPVRE